MAGKPMRPDPELVDQDNPELTEEFFARARPMIEVMPELVARLEAWQAQERRRRGDRGPQKSPTKVQLTLRIDRDVVEAYRATGPGWQVRMNAALRAGMTTGTR
jgi:uncharacterized protein (DUF4415 family)